MDISGCCFIQGDIHKIIKNVKDDSIDLIYWNPPFGTTHEFWDKNLNWSFLFDECFRVLKSTGMMVIHCSVPFNYELIKKAPKMPLYSWYWKKENTTNPLIAKIQPLRCVEEILVWKKEKNSYYPQMIGNELYEGKEQRLGYYDLGENPKSKDHYGRYTNHFIEMKREIDGASTRPEKMIELMIKSYTKPGDTIFDPTCYKGLSGKIAKKLGRNWLGVDLFFRPNWIDTVGISLPNPRSQATGADKAV